MSDGDPIDIFDGGSWMTVYPVEGEVTHTQVFTPPSLERVQDILRGYVEGAGAARVRGVAVQMFVNEEGRVRGLRLNARASEFARVHGLSNGSSVVGPAVVLSGPRAVWR